MARLPSLMVAHRLYGIPVAKLQEFSPGPVQQQSAQKVVLNDIIVANFVLHWSCILVPVHVQKSDASDAGLGIVIGIIEEDLIPTVLSSVSASYDGLSQG